MHKKGKKSELRMKAEWPIKQMDLLIENALREDLGERGDITTCCVIPAPMRGRGEFIAKEEGVVAGTGVVQRVFQKMDDRLSCVFIIQDGMRIQKDTVFGTVQGQMRSILQAERTALNFLQRLSGIATLTARFVQAVEGTGVKILDTRKTTPQMRFLEKYAVRQGGGQNHRFGLYDGILIKDNHIDAAGGIARAVKACLDSLGAEQKNLMIEVETRTLEEVKEAVALPIHRIMLDNMDIETMRRAVEEVQGKVEMEASGSISLENVRAVAETGVDYISIGSLTHSANALDISLKVRSN